jgi:F420H(2)-dependent quinone reductase
MVTALTRDRCDVHANVVPLAGRRGVAWWALGFDDPGAAVPVLSKDLPGNGYSTLRPEGRVGRTCPVEMPALQFARAYQNLVADPEVQVQVMADRFKARARTASAAEKPALWKTMSSI